VPDVIKRGKSKEVADALEKIKADEAVKAAYPKDFRSGGFNPRPMKTAKTYKYRLGTISEHALGNAVDIESKENPNMSVGSWKFIEKITGKAVDRSLARWKKEPESLWCDIKELNDLFVNAIAQEVKQVESEIAKAKAATDNVKSKDKEKEDLKPIDVVFAKKPFAMHSQELKKWAGGFFTLKWELVKQFHANGFKWGATFSNGVDLHHFELQSQKADEQKLPPVESKAKTSPD
jgi:hypothetical protein